MTTTAYTAEVTRQVRSLADDLGVTLTAENAAGFLAMYLSHLADSGEQGREIVAIYLTETVAAFAEEMGL